MRDSFLICLIVWSTLFAHIVTLSDSSSSTTSEHFDIDQVGVDLDPGGCDDPPHLTILVHSAPDHVQLRKVLRETWAAGRRDYRLVLKLTCDCQIVRFVNNYCRIKRVFVLGTVADEHLAQEIVKEAKLHKDILQVAKSIISLYVGSRNQTID